MGGPGARSIVFPIPAPLRPPPPQKKEDTEDSHKSAKAEPFKWLQILLCRVQGQGIVQKSEIAFQ